MTTTMRPPCSPSKRCKDARCGKCALIAIDASYEAGFVASEAKLAAKAARPDRVPPPPPIGVGDQLGGVLKALGLGESSGCACRSWRGRMNIWGPGGCRANRADIENHLRSEAGKVGWVKKLAAGAKAAAAGLYLNPLDPAAGLLDEAIRRAEAAVTPPSPTLLPPSRLVQVGPSGLETGRMGWAFNAGLVRFKGRLLMAYRCDWTGSRCHVAELTDDYSVVRTTPLELSHPRASTGQEDPRPFVCRDRLHVAYIGVENSRSQCRTSQLYARLTDDLGVERVYYPDIAGRQEPKEKNWSMFDHDGELLAVYQTGPRHVIVRIDGDRAERIADTPVAFPWSGGFLRGGAPPVLVGDRYYHWFHGRVGTDQFPWYNVGLAVFEARPPFRVVAQSPHPMLWGDMAANVTTDRSYACTAFVQGAVLDGGTWRVSMGWNDRGVRIAEWSFDEVNRAIGLPPPA